MSETGYQIPMVKADVELAIVYDCGTCGEANYIELDELAKEDEALLIGKATEAIVTGRQQTSKIEVMCENCGTTNIIKTIVF